MQANRSSRGAKPLDATDRNNVYVLQNWCIDKSQATLATFARLEHILTNT